MNAEYQGIYYCQLPHRQALFTMFIAIRQCFILTTAMNKTLVKILIFKSAAASMPA